MSYLPCKNPSCKSVGKPHPNCRCYGDMAAGGEVQHFCAVQRAHQGDCEYFADGGEAYAGVDPPPAMTVPEPVYDGSGTNEEPPGYEEPYDGSGTNEEPPDVIAAQEAATSPIETGLAGYQGALKGLIGPLAKTVMEENPLIFGSLDTAAKREEANPAAAGVGQATGLIGGLLTGVGVGGAAEKAGAALAARAATEASAGAKILSTAIQSGLIQTSDEATKWAFGQGDPVDAAGAATAIGASTLFGGFLGGLGVAASKASSAGLQKLADAKVGERALNFLRGMGFAAKAQDPALRELDAAMAAKAGYDMPRAYKSGAQFFDRYFLPTTLASTNAVHGWHEDGVEGAIKGAIYGGAAGFGGRAAGKLLGSKVIAPATLWVLSKGTTKGMAQAVQHAAEVAHGSKVISGAIDGLFKSVPAAAQSAVSAYGSEKLKNDLDNFIGNGGMTQSIQQQIYDDNGTNEEPPGFAEGGEVKKTKTPKGHIPAPTKVDDGVAMHYPEQNMLLSAARGRVSNYLMGLRPGKNAPKLPFDDEPDTRKQKKEYDRALGVAVAPMSVMKEIERGTVEPEHFKHLSSMYPELLSLLQKRATTKVVEAQLSGKKPPYKVRQGLSLLLGAPLSQEMTPQSIQAAQAVFSSGLSQPPTEPSPQKPSGGSGGSKTSLSKSDQAFLTGPQARQKRAQRET